MRRTRPVQTLMRDRNEVIKVDFNRARLAVLVITVLIDRRHGLDLTVDVEGLDARAFELPKLREGHARKLECTKRLRHEQQIPYP